MRNKLILLSAFMLSCLCVGGASAGQVSFTQKGGWQEDPSVHVRYKDKLRVTMTVLKTGAFITPIGKTYPASNKEETIYWGYVSVRFCNDKNTDWTGIIRVGEELEPAYEPGDGDNRLPLDLDQNEFQMTVKSNDCSAWGGRVIFKSTEEVRVSFRKS